MSSTAKFDFAARNGAFGVFNNRREPTEGGGKIKAIDLPVRFQVTLKELDMLVPTQGTPLSEFLFGDGARKRGGKPQLQTHLLSPLKVHRKPEHVKVTIFDSDTDKRRKMTFEDVKVKDPVIEFDESNVIYLTCKLQLHPGSLFARIADNVEDQTRPFECLAVQPELFEQEGEKPEKESQRDIDDEDGEGDEDEDEDE